MMGFSIGLSGLSVNQRLIDLTGQNITNAGTPGYHRQVGNLVPIAYGQQVGGGVRSVSRDWNRRPDRTHRQ